MTQRNSDQDGEVVFFDERVQLQFFDLIKNARERITFVTPYIDLWENLKRALRDGIERRVDITFFIRKDHNQPKPHDLQWLLENGVKVHEVPNLHAKIYLNETTVLVSSMNILRSSINDSKEFAMIVNNELHKKMFRDYVSALIPKFSTTQASHSIGNYVSGLIAKATESQTSPRSDRQISNTGTCAQCGRKIPFNKERPLCLDCWKKSHKRPFRSK